MNVSRTRSFGRDFRAAYRSEQERRSAAVAEDWAWAARRAVQDLTETRPGFLDGYAYAHEGERLPGGPYRVKMFGVGKKQTHRLVFRVLADDAVELVALRHLAQDDLTPLDL